MRLQILTVLFTVSAALAQMGPPPGGSGDGIWRRNAYYGELMTFDSCVGHQPNNGTYHYHANPLCLRAELNDNLVTVRSSRDGATYIELTSGWHHSPILGWALDGYPIYGPYGYTNPMDSTSPIKRIQSGFRLRSLTQRTSLPDWSLPNHTSVSQNLTPNQYGPAVSATFPLGRYVEDYEWVGGIGDLDQYNGRFTVTPEFLGGTYAYYVTIDNTGTPAFPFIVAGQFYGTLGGGFSSTVPPSASQYFSAGIYSSGPSTPTLTSWSTRYSTSYAKVVSGFDPSAGPSQTWPGANSLGITTSGSVTTPVLAETQQIRYTDSTVFVTSNGLAGYPMGPWFSADMTAGIFMNFPTGATTTFQLPRGPAPAATLTSTGMGSQGMWVNGVVMFNFLDGASYVNSTGVDGMAGNIPALDAAIISSASLEQGPLAPGSLVSALPLYFSVLSTSTATAPTTAWPTTLGGATVTVRDSSGVSLPAQISYASPAQLNFRLPTGLAAGAAVVTITAGAQAITSHIDVQPVYPNLVMTNSGALAAGTVTRVHGSTTTISNIGTDPIALNGDQVYVTLCGSGLGSATSATATIGGIPALVFFAGTQGTYPGLDQYNILIPGNASGMGSVNIVITAGGKTANPVNVTIE